MHKIFIALLFLMPLWSGAQSWNIAAGGGILYNTKTSKPGRFEMAPDLANPAAFVQLGYLKNKWETGLSISYRRYAVRHIGTLDFDGQFSQMPVQPFDFDYFETFPVIAFTPFLRRHFGHSKADFYAGVTAGLSTMPFSSNNTLVSDHLGKYNSPAGFTAGIHCGCNYPIAKRFALRNELSLDGLWMKPFNLQGIMWTAGLQYKLK